MTVSFDVSPGDAVLIKKIVDRSMRLERSHGGTPERLSTHMDITACHANGCPLNLPKLLAADDLNFMHDVFGIARHLDRETGQLLNFFDPRCSAPQPATQAA